MLVLLRRFHADLPRTRAVSLHVGAVISGMQKAFPAAQGRNCVAPLAPL